MATPIREIIDKHTVVVLNESLKRGFTQLPNYVLRDKSLSFGARLAFAVLLSYAWQHDRCFPGQERMAEDLGASARSVRTFLAELRAAGYIDWKRRGLNRTNVYFILDYRPLDREHAAAADRDGTAALDRKQASAPDRKRTAALDRKLSSA